MTLLVVTFVGAGAVDKLIGKREKWRKMGLGGVIFFQAHKDTILHEAMKRQNVITEVEKINNEISVIVNGANSGYALFMPFR